MKKLFQAIQQNDIETVKKLIENDTALVNCVAKQPPEKDDGQSPLQVSLKNGNLKIAEYLIDMGADVNFIEDVSCCNVWRVPVIHDAINASVMNCRWNINESSGVKVFSTEQNAKKAYSVLKKMLDLGADINATDSYGNSGIWRFCLQASQILPSYDYGAQCERNDRIFTKDLEDDLYNILSLLCESGTDFYYNSPNMNCSVLDLYRDGSLAKLLRRVLNAD